MSERREYQRFDINTVLEYKPLSEITRSFFGVTKNFSAQGFCLETHHTDIQPGDGLEVKLRHPIDDMVLSIPGSVVWKRNAPQFAHALGIRLHDMELDTRVRMLETMSSAGSIPVDAFFAGEAAGRESSTADRMDSTEPEEFQEMPVKLGSEARSAKPAEETCMVRDEAALRNTWRRAMKMNSLQSPFEKLAGSAGALRKSITDMQQIQLSWKDLRDRADVFTLDRIKKSLSSLGVRIWENRFLPHVMIAAVFLGILAYLTGMMFGNSGDTTIPDEAMLRQSAPAAVEQVQSDEVSISESLPGDIKVIDEPVSVKPQITEKITPDRVSRVKPKIDRRSPASAAQTVEQYPFHIQVGVWSHAENARGILAKLKKEYPRAYIRDEGRLHRVIIPGISSSEEAAPILRDLEKRFKIEALLKRGNS